MATPEEFMDYFRTNYPGPDTIICEPDWHAPKIYRAAVRASAHADLLAASKAALTRLAHPTKCATARPTEEWEEHGSWHFENCQCDIRTLEAAIAKAEA